MLFFETYVSSLHYFLHCFSLTFSKCFLKRCLFIVFLYRLPNIDFPKVHFEKFFRRHVFTKSPREKRLIDVGLRPKRAASGLVAFYAGHACINSGLPNDVPASILTRLKNTFENS